MKVILMMAVSADGYITKHGDGLVDWSSKEDKKAFVAKTKGAGVIIYGNKTFQTFNKPLPGRLNIVMTRTVEGKQSEPGLLEYSNQSPEVLLESLKQKGHEQVIVAGGAAINSLFFSKNLIDEIYLTVEPLIFGDGKRLTENLHMDINLVLLNQEMLNENTILLHYKVKR
jgi:dihydrofolate reductase